MAKESYNATILPGQLVQVDVEVCLKNNSTLRPSDVHRVLRLAAESHAGHWMTGNLPLLSSPEAASGGIGHGSAGFALPSHILAHIHSARVCELPPPFTDTGVPACAAEAIIHVYQLCGEGPTQEDIGGEGQEDGGLSAYSSWFMPAGDMEGMWESLVYDSDVKQSLLAYADSAMRFAEAGVDSNLISWNHVVLLHGPPGTGKTSLCKALAHKLAIRLGARYPSAQLIEINAHSLFSRWFSESGKLVARLFAHITELVDDDDSLVFVLIDEVESLTAARKAAVSGSEPSDAVRVVNAVLTAIDALKSRKNVMILTTSNVSEAIDVAFVDRADIRAYIGPPSAKARYDILASTLQELQRSKIVLPEVPIIPSSSAEECHRHVLELLDSVTGAPVTRVPDEFVAEVLAAAGKLESSGSFEAMALTATPAIKLAIQADAADLHKGVITPSMLATAILYEAAVTAEGFSGRALRKLPLQAHARFVRRPVVHPILMADALRHTALSELANRAMLESS